MVKKSTHTVIVPDAEQHASLAVIRSLGRAGFRVIAASHAPHPLGFSSRYAECRELIASPLERPEQFSADVERLWKLYGATLLMPVTEQSTRALLEFPLPPGAPQLPVPSARVFSTITDKAALMHLAGSLGISVPQQHLIADLETAANAAALHFPVVLKPARSLGIASRFSVQYASAFEDLMQKLRLLPADAFPILAQERIEGPGTGVFLLRWHDAVIARFAHQREREMPPSGGGSISCRSIALEDAPLVDAERLLERLEWNGVAMVEFKVCHRTGRPFLMEINPRFWGSLQLAIDAGVDFPLLLAKAMLGEPTTQQPPYRVGQRLRKIWGELDWALALLRKSSAQLNLPPSFPPRWRALASLARFGKTTRVETFRLRDPMPFFTDGRAWVAQHVRTRFNR